MTTKKRIAPPVRKGSIKRKAAKKQNFKPNQYIVYPAHGVGKVTSIEKEVIAGFDIEVYVVSFEQEKMILRVPTNKAAASGMRSLMSSKMLLQRLKAARASSAPCGLAARKNTKEKSIQAILF